MLILNKRENRCSPGELALRCLGIFLALVVVLGFAGCGGAENSSSPSSAGTFSPSTPAETVSPEPVEPLLPTEPSPSPPPPSPSPPPPSPSPPPCTTRDEPWQQDVFCPSENFYQYCAEPSKAVSSRAKQGTYVDENNWLRSWSNKTYLWYDEIEDVDPVCCTNPEEYFLKMRTEQTTPSGKRKDRFHFSESTEEYRQFSQEGITVGYGARFKVLKSTPPRNVVVRNTEPGSPATAADVNLVRGTRILTVDGIDIVNSNDSDDGDKINAALSPSVGDTHTFTVKDPGASSQERSVTMTAREITLHPVQNVEVFTTSEGDRVGYMLFNRPLINSEVQHL